MNRLRNIVIGITLFCLVLPFILLVDIYPLYRFGMYSKSLKELDVIELYHIELNYRDSSVVYESGFQQDLIRRYIYRQEAKLLLQKIYETNATDTLIRSVELHSQEFRHNKATTETKLVEKLDVKK